MANHGTPSEFPGWYVNFQTAVLRNLPRPGAGLNQITQENARFWELNGAGLVKALSVALKTTGKGCPSCGFPMGSINNELICLNCGETRKEREEEPLGRCPKCNSPLQFRGFACNKCVRCTECDFERRCATQS